MGDLSEEAMLDYISAAGGRVRNSDLVRSYQHLINHSEQESRAKYRDEFKVIVDKIALVKTENGEKYLVLKKKYKQLMQERQRERERQREVMSAGAKQASVPRPTALVQWEGGGVICANPSWDPPPPACASLGENAVDSVPGPSQQPKKPTLVSWCEGPAITLTEDTTSPEPAGKMELPSILVQDERCPPPEEQDEAPQLLPQEVAEESPPLSHREDDIDPETGSKSGSEQDEDGAESVGSTAVALDPLEKEWMRTAACGLQAHLNQLLKQEPSLAYKKDFTSTALHWAAKHGKEDMATMLANAGVDVNTKAGYTPLHIAALHGHRHIVDLLVRTYGAKENLRDYSGHLAFQYLNMEDSREEGRGLQFPVSQGIERRNRKLSSLFTHKNSGSSKKKWGSVEDLAAVEEEKGGPQLLLPPTFRPRKFSR